MNPRSIADHWNRESMRYIARMSIDLPRRAQLIAQELSLPLSSVANTLGLLDGGATVPFIARYRKEATPGLDDAAVAQIATHDVVVQAREARRHTVLQALQEQGLLTPTLARQLSAASTLSEIEDIYLPYRPKRRTRAQVAREQGLQPLADILLAQSPQSSTREQLATPYLDEGKGLPDVDAVWDGARDIVAEMIAENAQLRSQLRRRYETEALLSVEIARGKSKAPQLATYQDHVGRSERASKVPSHRILAAERGEHEGVLKVQLTVAQADVLALAKSSVVRPNAAPVLAREMEQAVADAAVRLLMPSIEAEQRRALKARADAEAIAVFSKNLNAVLLASPLGAQPVIAIDPGLRTGCKVVALDAQGAVLGHDTIYPHTGRESEAAVAFGAFVRRHPAPTVAVGNGTAGRETVAFVKKLQSAQVIAKEIRVVSVSEAGASVYSASDIARDELPDLDVSVRGAVSIGRRLQDPLAELVKIDAKSIGVGQYQHDVDQAQLAQSLESVVERAVNQVGVNLNTASVTLLRYVAGLGPALAKAIVSYRTEHGAFDSRMQLKKVPRLGAKAFEQCAGFLRIVHGSEALDASAVHPERYGLVQAMAKDCGVSRGELVGNEHLATRIALEKYVDQAAGIGIPTLADIILELKKPGRDPRAQFGEVDFDPAVTELTDVKVGQVLSGVITNVAAFGAFVDIGVHQDGLVHVSELAHRFVRDPLEVVQVGDRVRVKVLQVDALRKRVSLSIKALTVAVTSPPTAIQPFNGLRRS
jgi:protein Tex